MTDLLLISPPYFSDLREAEAILPPLGIAYIAAYVRQNGYSVKILDCTPLELSWDELFKTIQQINPKVVGISATTPLMNNAFKVANIVKKANPNVPVVCGGPHATALPEFTLKQSNDVDIICIAEGEQTMLELLQHFIDSKKALNDILGIAYREQEMIAKTLPRPLWQDIDKLPFPARDLLPMKKYRPSFKWYHRTPFTTMMTTRGCPFNCLFCDSRLTFGRKVRARSPENVIMEIKHLINNFGIKDINIYDDTFTLDKKRVNEICRKMREERLDISWGCLSRVDTLDETTITNMKKAGCHMMSFGIESGSPKMLKIIRKGTTIEQATKTLKLVRKHGIDSSASFVLGVPGETPETFQQTINFAIKLNPTYAQFFRVVPFPGTDLFHLAESEGLLEEGFSWERFNEMSKTPLIKLDTFSVEALNTFTKVAFKKFYLRPSKMFEYAMKMTNPHKIIGYYRAFKTFLRLK